MDIEAALDRYEDAPSGLSRVCWAQAVPIRDHAAFRALGNLVEYTDGAGFAKPAADVLAARCHMEVPELAAALRSLEELGYLDRAVSSSGRMFYRVLMPGLTGVEPIMLPDDIPATDIPNSWRHPVGPDRIPIPAENTAAVNPTLFEGL